MAGGTSWRQVGDKSGDKLETSWRQVGDKLETSMETSFNFKGKTCLKLVSNLSQTCPKLVSSGLQHVPETCLQLVPGERPGLGIQQGKTNLLPRLPSPIREKTRGNATNVRGFFQRRVG